MTFQPLLPDQTSHVAPAMLAVPIFEPIGWIEPARLSQTIDLGAVVLPASWCVGRDLWNQMSYAAS